jgi:hypothetical protein
LNDAEVAVGASLGRRSPAAPGFLAVGLLSGLARDGEIKMKKQKILVGLWIFAALLELLAGLRDLFAPGFFTISGQVKSQGDILLEFVAAACFFALAFLTSKAHQAKSLNHK